MSRPRTILAIIGSSWGTVDWLLPMLTAAQQARGARFYIYLRKPALHHDAERYADLVSTIRSHGGKLLAPATVCCGLPLVVKILLCWQYWLHQVRVQRCFVKSSLGLVWRLARSLVGKTPFRASKNLPSRPLITALRWHVGQPVDLLFHDFERDDLSEFYREFNNAAIFVVPHGTNWLEERNTETSLRGFNEVSKWPPDAMPENATLLTGRASDIEVFKKIGARCEVVPVGIPKFDPAWIARLNEHSAHLAPIQRHGAAGTLLFLLMPMGKSSTKEAFCSHVEAVLRLAHRLKLRLLVKLHPRQSASEIHSVVRKFPGLDLHWCNTSVLRAAACADIVVSFPSSAVMDAVAAGKPVLEFFDYTGQDYATFVNSAGRTTSIYRKENLVVPINTSEQLETFVVRGLVDPCFLHSIACKQQAALDRLLEHRAGCIDRCLAMIWRTIERRAA